MHNMPAFLESLFGESWRTATLGMILIVLSLPVFGIGALLIVFDQPGAGGTVIGQGVLMIVTGAGFLMTRDNTASKQAKHELKQDIKAVEVVAEKKAEEVAVEVVKEKTAEVQQQR